MQVPKNLLEQHGSPDKKAKKLEDEGNLLSSKKTIIKFFKEEDGHGSDPALKRTGKFCGGLIADIKRKLPWYKSDYTDALNLQSVSAISFMFFALLSPIITFGALLEGQF